MKKYRVNVNGTVYEVELEEITGIDFFVNLPKAVRRSLPPCPATFWL